MATNHLYFFSPALRFSLSFCTGTTGYGSVRNGKIGSLGPREEAGRKRKGGEEKNTYSTDQTGEGKLLSKEMTLD